MKQTSTWEVKVGTFNQTMTPKVQCHFHKSHPLVHILKQMDTIHVLQFLQVALIASHRRLSLADYLPTLGFLQKLCISLYSAMRVTFPAIFIPDLKALIMCSEGRRSWGFTFCNFSCLLVHFRFTNILFFKLIFIIFCNFSIIELHICFIPLYSFLLLVLCELPSSCFNVKAGNT
jgi:hypothetical protein